MKAWVIEVLIRKADVEIGKNIFGEKAKLPVDLCLTDGMIGILPVFKRKKDATKYAKSLKNLSSIPGITELII